jgi:hypothetical protein
MSQSENVPRFHIKSARAMGSFKGPVSLGRRIPPRFPLFSTAGGERSSMWVRTVSLFLIDQTTRSRCCQCRADGRLPGSEGKDADPVNTLPWEEFATDREAVMEVLDSQLMRITLLDTAYQTTGTIALDRLTDDIAFVTRDTIVTASFRLENAFKPLRTIHSSGAVLSEFGSVMEPQPGIIKKVIASPFAKSDVEVYSHGWMTRICYLPQVRQVVLSQTHPYTLSWCNVDSASCARLHVPAPFSTEDNMEYKVEGESRTASILPSGKALQPMVVRDLIVVPLMSATLEENYLDCYAFSGSFVQRLRVPPLPKNTDPISACMSPEGELFLLLRDRDGITWIERFAVRLSAQ